VLYAEKGMALLDDVNGISNLNMTEVGKRFSCHSFARWMRGKKEWIFSSKCNLNYTFIHNIFVEEQFPDEL
jgi:hypothetical protein